MTALAPVQTHDLAPVVRAQVNSIQELMSSVMHKDEHYGSIPGCGDKLILLKPGAEKLCLAFNFAVSLEIQKDADENGHREYEVRCKLASRESGTFVGEGIGVCSTYESKYRYRTKNTGRAVPGDYWETRDPQLLGGSQYSPRKVDGSWVIFEQVQHENPADYWNTCAKMAKKRALVDAVLTATAASDIFTQDLDEMGDSEVAAQQPSAPPQQDASVQRGAEPASNAAPRGTEEATGDLAPSGSVFELRSVKKIKDGEGKNGPWTLWAIVTSTGHEVKTFSRTVHDAALKCIEDGQAAVIRYSQNNYGANVEELVPQQASPGELFQYVGTVSEVRHEERKDSKGEAVGVYLIETQHGRFGTMSDKVASAFEAAMETGTEIRWTAVDQPAGGKRIVSVD